MLETLSALVGHLEGTTHGGKVVVWAHNSHLGDAQYTQMGERGEINLGHLARKRYGREAVLIGFTTWSGTVTAATDWDGPAERKHVRPALANSWEALFHAAEIPKFVLNFRDNPTLAQSLGGELLERAIGVIYRPSTERQSHYFMARMAQQFDAVIHLDHTRAVEPLERTAEWTAEWPETYPSGV